MKKLIFCMLTLFIGLTACTKDINVVVDDALVNYKTAGELSVTVLGENDAPIEGVKLYLYQNEIELHEATTDIKGNASFGKLNIGTYTIYTNELVINDIRYNIIKWVQVLPSEVNEIVIRPIGYSGRVTLNIFETLPATSSTYSTPAPLTSGKVALIPIEYRQASFNQLIAAKVVEGSLNGTSNQIVFEKVPIGNYLIMVYVDQNHYTLGQYSNYDYYQPFYFRVLKNDVLTINTVVRGNELFDYKGTAVINTKEILSSGNYSSDNVIRNLTYGKIALIPWFTSSSYTEYGYNQLLDMAIAIKTVPPTGEAVEFTNIPIGNYNVLAFTDKGFYLLNNTSSMYNSLSTFVGANRSTTSNGFIYGHYLKDYFYDVTCSVSNFSSTDNSNVYVLRSSAYNSLTTTERVTESAISALALANATTDNAGKVTLSSIAYESVHFVFFSQSGKKTATQKIIYGPTSFSVYLY